MKLRQWQSECITQAMHQYAKRDRHFLCLATPGAGKTHMASTLAAHLLANDLVDLVICFAPSVIVAEDFRTALCIQCDERFDGRLGARGTTLTYQAMLCQTETFWALFRDHRVFAIFDEIHHCAGQDAANANAWGERLITQIQERAACTLALTGTPWRSDQRPIALARYGIETVSCDYAYGLDRAIEEGVCRVPQLTLIDNENIEVRSAGKVKTYASLREVMDDHACRYEDLLNASPLIKYCLSQANRQLTTLRRDMPEAGGLIVATSVAHARQIAALLKSEFDELAAIATYQEADALGTIRRFTHSKEKWIISVGMISEGTNVPRLRVCCHLTRVKTELYFRQVLGRILRANGRRGEKAYFYMPAEPTLIEYAERLAQDIPNANPVILDSKADKIQVTTPYSQAPSTGTIDRSTEVYIPADSDSESALNDAETLYSSSLAQTYENCVNWSDHFRRDVLAIKGLSSRSKKLPGQLPDRN